MKPLFFCLLILYSAITYAKDVFHKPVTIFNYISAVGYPEVSSTMGELPELKTLPAGSDANPSITKFDLRTVGSCQQKYTSKGILKYVFTDYPSKGISSSCFFEYYYLHYYDDPFNCISGTTKSYFKVVACSPELTAECAHVSSSGVADCSIRASSKLRNRY